MWRHYQVDLSWQTVVARSYDIANLWDDPLGALQRIFFLQKSEITMEVGGWVQVSLNFFFCGKLSQNSPKPVLIFWSSGPCVFCLYIHC